MPQIDPSSCFQTCREFESQAVSILLPHDRGRTRRHPFQVVLKLIAIQCRQQCLELSYYKAISRFGWEGSDCQNGASQSSSAIGNELVKSPIDAIGLALQSLCNCWYMGEEDTGFLSWSTKFLRDQNCCKLNQARTWIDFGWGVWN